MINITDIVQSSRWKTFMAKLYGFGATVVIMGALFKINHWPGGSFIITLGLVTEAIIFFFSAFEPMHEELDWTLVYPELAGISDPDEIENFKEAAMIEGGRSVERIEGVMGQSGGGGIGSLTTGVDEASFAKLEEGFNKLNKTASGMADITKATIASQEFVSNLQTATKAVGTLNETYETTTVTIRESTTSLSNAYFQTADKIVKSGDEIANSYKEIALTIQNEQKNISLESKEHDFQMDLLNKSLAELNGVYKNQIKETSEHMKGSVELYAGLHSMIANLKQSVEETSKYKEEMTKLKDSIASLNSIYGNMLSTMDVLTK